ncbi:hypothetical protein ACVWZ6_007160 [Bradyrhizobium sp. GM6.1]
MTEAEQQQQCWIQRDLGQSGASTRTIGRTTALIAGLAAAAMPKLTPSTTAIAKPANNRIRVAAISC